MKADRIEANDVTAILRLRAIICRAAQRDSMSWWDDESLTPYARVILDPLFPRTAPTAAIKIAFESARLRYRAAFAVTTARVLHLFSLDDGTEMGLADAERAYTVPSESAIPDVEAFRRALGPDWRDYEVTNRGAGGLLEIKARRGSPRDSLDVARALAVAHAEGGPGTPAFPFIRVS